MNRTEKTAQIAEIKGKFDRAISVALLDFQGLSVETVTDLRREFRKAKIEYKVLKNTVIRHALKDSAYQSLAGDLTPNRGAAASKTHPAVRGMTGVAFSYEDPSAPVKIIQAFKKAKADKAEKLKFKTGLVGGSLVNEETLGKMPNLKETQGHILGLVQAPAANLYATLLMPGIQIVAILDTWVEKQKAAAEGK